MNSTAAKLTVTASIPRRTSCGRAAARARAAGFTILEIMIATAILTLGLVSVLALFPAAIHTGKQVMDTSTAVVIAESVADSIREGMRNHLRSTTSQRGSDHYFIFRHDGVTDPVPNEKVAERPNKDYYILLPRFPEGTNFSGRTETIRRRRAMQQGKVFVYPESDASANGGGSALLADNDGNDFSGEFSNGKSYNDIRIDKVYKLGTLLPDVDTTLASERVLEDQQIESLKQYSFAFAVRVSYLDSNLSSNSAQFQPGNRLYNFHIMVFRSFMPPGEPYQKHDAPVYDVNFEVAL